MTIPNRIEVQEVAHSTRGASGSHRWMNCHGSPNLIAKLVAEFGSKVKDAGREANLGTAAHELASICLQEDTEPWEYMGVKIASRNDVFEVDEDMASSVQTYVDFVRKKIKQFRDAGHEVKVHIENPMSSMLDEDAYGTGDTLIEVVGDRLIVIDFKNGRHVCVEPTSSQLKYYGYLAVENASEGVDTDDYKVVELYIVQPRMAHPKGPIRRHVTDVEALTSWFYDELLPAMERTRDPDAILQVGTWCNFCPALDHCPAVTSDLADLNLNVAPEAMDDEQLEEIALKEKAFTKFLERAKAQMYKRAMAGSKFKHHKLVRKKANRVFKKTLEIKSEGGGKTVLKFEDEVEKKFGDDAYDEPTLKTPPNIEKLDGGASFVKKWAYTPDTGLTLAHESDKRIEVRRPMDEFLDVADVADL